MHVNVTELGEFGYEFVRRGTFICIIIQAPLDYILKILG